MNGKNKTLALALLLVVLLLGGAAGAAVERFVADESACAAIEAGHREGRGRRESYLDWLTQELDLSADQRARVEQTVERHREAVSALWREVRPRFEQMKTRLREEIRAVLNDEQRATYERLLKRESEHRRRGRQGSW